jgi:hypothetical protein
LAVDLHLTVEGGGEGSPQEQAAEVWSDAKEVWLAIEGAWQYRIEDLLVARAKGFLPRRHPWRAVGRGDSAEEWDWTPASVVAESKYEEPSSVTRLGASEEGGRRSAP